MTEFNDTVKNGAIENIVSFLKNPEGKNSLAQVSLILESVQNAFVTNDNSKNAQSNLVRFLETFIKQLAARTEGEIFAINYPFYHKKSDISFILP